MTLLMPVPAVIDDGFNDAAAGTGFAICRGKGSESRFGGLCRTSEASPTDKFTGTVKSRSVAELTLTPTTIPLSVAVVPLPKLLPITLTGCPGLITDGVTEVIVGKPATTWKGMPLEVPPPGAGFKTVSGVVPKGISTGRVAVSWVSLTRTVFSCTAPMKTKAPSTNPVPVTASGRFA